MAVSDCNETMQTLQETGYLAGAAVCQWSSMLAAGQTASLEHGASLLACSSRNTSFLR
jgi:hypothetical protein